MLIFFSTIVLFFSCKDENHSTDKTEVPKADKLLKELIEKADKNPDSIQYRVDVIDALDSLERFKEALFHMNILLKKDSINNSYWSRNALLLERSGDTTAAIESYIRSINIYPDVVTQLYLANIFAERKDDRALMLVNNVSKTMPDDETLANCDFIAGIYQARKGNIQLAEQLFNRCISHNVKYMEAYLEKGFLYFDQKKYNEALNVFQAAGNVEPTYADAFYWQAKTFEALGRIPEAINMYDQSLRLDPDLKEASAALTRLGGQKG
jgi:tetratricopeptide (TPR) repeat protein